MLGDSDWGEKLSKFKCVQIVNRRRCRRWLCDNEDDSYDSTKVAWWHGNTEAIQHSQPVVLGCLLEECWHKSRKTHCGAANMPERMCFYCNSLYILFAEFHFVFSAGIRLHRACCGQQQCGGNLELWHTWLCAISYRKTEMEKKTNKIRSSPWHLRLFLRWQCWCKPWIHCDKRIDNCRLSKTSQVEIQNNACNLKGREDFVTTDKVLNVCVLFDSTIRWHRVLQAQPARFCEIRFYFRLGWHFARNPYCFSSAFLHATKQTSADWMKRKKSFETGTKQIYAVFAISFQFRMTCVSIWLSANRRMISNIFIVEPFFGESPAEMLSRQQNNVLAFRIFSISIFFRCLIIFRRISFGIVFVCTGVGTSL